ncbi:MAG: ribosomal RNA small subunit methyltransferase A [Planctomycetota bacterium]|nr:MAG: ribosomal RNA small subunit methyltransferase A [Planctomycetota bacterium]
MLSAEGISPRRRHGQNFLLDENLLASIVRDAELSPGSSVLEIGPGPGLLTRHLLSAGHRVIAVEIDAGMSRVAQRVLAPVAEQLTWIEADALVGRRLGAELDAQLGSVSALVANLPYNISGPLLAALFTHRDLPERMVVLVQKEMAERLLAEPGGRQWGSLSVLRAVTMKGRTLRRVPPGAFWPAPKVDSAVIRLDRLSDLPSPEALDGLQRFLALAFHNRRKTLLNSVSEASGERPGRVLERLGASNFQQKIRAEAANAVQLCALAHSWAVSAPGERDRP